MQKITDQDLRGVIEHLEYEIWMLSSLTEEIGSEKYCERNQKHILNALLESYLVHFRSLIDFFFNDSGKDDDVLAVHFFDSGEWRQYCPKNSFSGLKVKINKQIVHLTLERTVVPKEKLWEISEMSKDISGLINLFSMRLSANNKFTDLSMLLKRHISKLGSHRNSIDVSSGTIFN